MALDPRATSELFRLKLEGALTDVQVEAGHRMAEVYAQYERLKGLRRSAASPVYLASFGGAGVAEERMDDAHLDRHVKQLRRATRAWLKLQEALPAWPPEAKGMVERVCVDNGRIVSCHYGDLQALLQRLAVYFELVAQPRNGAPVATAPHHKWLKPVLKTVAAIEQRPARGPKRGDPNKKPFMQVLGKLRPDLTPDELEQAYDVAKALKDRDGLRRRPATPKERPFQ